MNVRVAESVRQAVAAGQAVVALESTIITHGMPYPQNIETARNLEEIIRQEGAISATIGILNTGEAIVGLTPEEIKRLAQCEHVQKISRRDLAVVLASRETGGTTVAATMILAAYAGIAVFATGGIGGVHRGATTTFDVSADVVELAQTPVVVVCSGAKAILDLALTQEVLETYGVPVIGYQCETWPSFYARSSSLAVDVRLDDPLQVAAVWQAQQSLALRGGLLVMNPIPAQYGLKAQDVELWIQESLKVAAAKKIRGKALTPFLLAAVEHASKGESLRANIELVKHNARIGAQIALAIANKTTSR